MSYKNDLNNPFLTRKARAKLEGKEIKTTNTDLPDKLKTNQNKSFAKGLLTSQAMGKDARPKRVGFRFI